MNETRADVEGILRASGPFAPERATVRWRRLIAVACLGSSTYGLAMGSLGGKLAGALYSAVKMPALLLGTTAVCVPSFYVFNALLGLRADFAPALRGILAAQGTAAVALCAWTPVTLFFYASGIDYPVALLWNVSALGLAAGAGQITLGRHYRPLLERDRRHRHALTTWFVLYLFVSVKVAWVLRPFVGDPRLETNFVRPDAWQENPYANLFWTAAGLVWGAWRTLMGG
ncbi:MAG: hypothetical protein GY711_19485 [bacterium]|nr:hypothetical protein [bacterium]